MVQDINKYDEPYFHRTHQVDGVEICDEHMLLLNKYPVEKTDYSQLGFIRFDRKDVDFSKIKFTENDLDYMKRLASMSKFLLLNNDKVFNLDKLKSNYNAILQKKGYRSTTGTIKKTNLKTDFISFYGKQALEQLESTLKLESYDTWLDKILSPKNINISPLRHLLLIDFLSGDIVKFFSNEYNLKEPFGEGPWPCLNPVTTHYRHLTIDRCKLSRGKTYNQVVGTFECECGFVYSRTGPDTSEKDRFRVGRIKQFGHLWENELQILLKQNMSIREISRSMKCDPKTVRKHMNRTKNNTGIFSDKMMKSRSEDKARGYLKSIQSLRKENVKATRSLIKQSLHKEYMWLYRYDKDALYNILPKTARSDQIISGRVDWIKRDKEVLRCIKDEYKSLLNNSFSKRVTKSLLLRKCKCQSMYEKNAGKLPETSKFIQSVIESSREYHIRKAKRVCRKLLADQTNVELWKVMKLAGVREEFKNEIIDTVESYRRRQF